MIVDAGIGLPSHACQVMEWGFDGVLLTTVVSRACFASGERRFLQHSQSPELRQSYQPPQLTSIWVSHADAEQLSGQRRPERRSKSPLPDRRTALDPARAQAAILTRSEGAIPSFLRWIEVWRYKTTTGHALTLEKR